MLEVLNNCFFVWWCVKLLRLGNMLYRNKCYVGVEWLIVKESQLIDLKDI